MLLRDQSKAATQIIHFFRDRLEWGQNLVPVLVWLRLPGRAAEVWMLLSSIFSRLA